MENLQLYSTNILLGGNMKYDLIVENIDDELIISKFNITPISDKLPYNVNLDDILNYDHQNNISSYYKSIQGYFYEDFIDPQLKSYWPLITNNTKVYDDTFYMGCKRSSYDKYGKQFEFFVPIWLENVNESVKLRLELYAGSILLGSKNIDIYNRNSNNRFNDYIGNYFKHIGVFGEGDDKLMYVDLSNKYSSIHGVDITSGDVSTKDTSLLVNNLLHRERPLMEFDYLLINEFAKNKTIAKQLFNFNVCFNIDDILPQVIYAKMIDKPIKFKAYIEVDGIRLDIKDFYTNYDYIKRDTFNPINIKDIVDSQKSDNNRNDSNVLDYLKDNQYIDFMDKNKVPQKICHWVLKDFPTYVFNLYNGFSGEMANDKICDHYYGLGGDLKNSSKFVPWLNTYTLSYWNNLDKFIRYNSFYSSYYNTLGSTMINNFIYKCDDKVSKFLLLKYDGTEWDEFKNKGYTCYQLEDDLYIITVDLNYYIIMSNNFDKLSFKNIKQLIAEKISVSELKELYDFMDGLVEPISISLYKSLNINNADGPSKSIEEIQYSKNNVSYNYLYRYDGYIKPGFIGDNVIYFKDIFDENKYKKYLPYNYPPLYPSIGFYCFNKKDLNYNLYDFLENEYKWFNENEWYYLRPYIQLNDSYICNDAEEIVRAYFKDIYRDDVVDYIISQYDVKYELIELEVEENCKQKYRFDIKLKLK